jgi:hypothetical protein
MSRQTNTIAVTTGIGTGKNTLHLIGLDEHGTIVLREKLARGRIRTRLAKCTAMPDWDGGSYASLRPDREHADISETGLIVLSKLVVRSGR